MPVRWALTIWQPWASAIVYGPKRVENRTWAPPPSLIGQWLAIHAGKQIDDEDAFDFCRDNGYDPGPKDALPRCAILGVARVVGVRRDPPGLSGDGFYVGPVGWLFGDVTPLAEPVPVKGAQKLWAVTDALRAQFRRVEAPLNTPAVATSKTP